MVWFSGPDHERHRGFMCVCVCVCVCVLCVRAFSLSVSWIMSSGESCHILKTLKRFCEEVHLIWNLGMLPMTSKEVRPHPQ